MQNMEAPLIYDWSAEKYGRLVPNQIKEFINAELNCLSAIKNLKRRTVIDVGAGYGRTLPNIAPKVKNLIAVEINQAMFDELERRSQQYKNVTAIQGDANELTSLLKGIDVTSPILICFQNSLGTWEGDSTKAMAEMRNYAQQRNGDVIISVFLQKALRTKGIDLYTSISDLTGLPDLHTTDFEKGVFRSETGYVSRWRTDQEIKSISELLGGKVRKIEGPYFTILHAKY